MWVFSIGHHVRDISGSDSHGHNVCYGTYVQVDNHDDEEQMATSYVHNYDYEVYKNDGHFYMSNLSTLYHNYCDDTNYLKEILCGERTHSIVTILL